MGSTVRERSTLAPEARILLASDPWTYSEVIRRRKRAREELEGATDAEVTVRMYPSIAAAGGCVRSDLSPHLRGHREPAATREASLDGGSVSVSLGEEATWFACQDFYTDEFRVRQILPGSDGSSVEADLPAVRGAPSWCTASIRAAAGSPAILFGLADGSVALWRGGRFLVFPVGEDGRGGEPSEWAVPPPSFGTGPLRVRRIAAIDGPSGSRAVAAIGAAEALHVVDLSTGVRRELWRNPRAWLVDLTSETGLLWAEYTTGVITLAEGEEEPVVRAPWPQVRPPVDSDPWRVSPPGSSPHRYWWCPARYTVSAGSALLREATSVLNDVTSVRFLLPVNDTRLFVATQRGAFLWEPSTRRVLSIVSDRRPGTWCAPGRETYLCDRGDAYYAIGIAAGPDAWCPFVARERRWADAPEPVLETLRRPDLFVRYAIPVGTQAYLSASRRRIALYRRPEERGRYATVTVARTEDGCIDGPFRVPYRSEGRIVVARGVRFTRDENAIVVPSATGYSLFLLGGRPVGAG